MRQLILAPGAGLSVENPVGGVLTFKITTEASGGALTAIETTAARQDGPPFHVHDQDERIYTLDPRSATSRHSHVSRPRRVHGPLRTA